MLIKILKKGSIVLAWASMILLSISPILIFHGQGRSCMLWFIIPYTFILSLIWLMVYLNESW
jgi:hypothetical protein